MKRWRRLTGHCIIVAMLSLSFSTAPAVAQNPSIYSRPKAVPERGSSNFDASLRCMDELLARSNYASGVPVYVTPLLKEETVGASTRDMIVSTLSRISERSRAFKIFVVDPTDPPSTPTRESLFVGGAISAFDKGVGSSGGGGGISVGPLSLGYRGQVLDSVVNLTIYLQDSNKAVLPLTTENVSIALRTKSKGGDLSGNVGILGATVGLDFAQAEGPSQAVRALIDLALIQSIGSWAGVPYQRCLTLPQTDPRAIQTARKAFERMKPADHLRVIAAALTARGLYRGPVPNGVMTDVLRQAISDYEVQQQLPPLGMVSFDLYYSLYGESYGAPGAPPVAVMATQTGDNPLGLRVSPYGSNFVVPLSGDALIRVGLRASFVVSTVRDAHVTCYYTDARLRTTRIFPNPQRPSDRLRRGDTLVLPGPEDIYTIEPDTVDANESITCAAATEMIPADRLGALATELRPGSPKVEIADAAQLESRLRQLGLPGLSVYRFTYVGACVRKSDGELDRKCP